MDEKRHQPYGNLTGSGRAFGQVAENLGLRMSPTASQSGVVLVVARLLIGIAY